MAFVGALVGIALAPFAFRDVLRDMRRTAAARMDRALEVPSELDPRRAALRHGATSR
jgi:hypothetical protein